MAKRKKHQKKSQQKNYSTISAHKRQGKKLIPPLVDNFDFTNSSWTDDRLPEMPLGDSSCDTPTPRIRTKCIPAGC